jgi:hypoxanthine phosphoribosyltransferase
MHVRPKNAFSIKSAELAPSVPRDNIHALVDHLGSFVPEVVVYIDRGGRRLGRALAAHYEAPALAMDIAYPLSRLPHPILTWLVLPIKEIAYRITAPRLTSSPNSGITRLSANAAVLLVDDSSSSGKTVRTARQVLRMLGHRGIVRVAVGRAGKKAAGLVDAAVHGTAVHRYSDRS